MSTRPELRDCPFCKSSGEDYIYFIVHNVITSESEFDCGFSVRCIECGAEVHDEYADEAARLWNGEDKPADDEGDAS